MRSNSFFRRGQRPTFKCVTCTRTSRDTGDGVDHLCHQCFEIASYDNQVNDSGEPCPPDTLAYCERMLREAVKKGGNEQRIRAHNEYIWPKKPVKEKEVPIDAPSPIFNIDTSKSYKTEKALMGALAKLGLVELRPLVVCNRAGRFTAVFGLHLSGMAASGDVMCAARHGFKTID